MLSLKETAIKYDLIAKKSLGQNFIFDHNLTDKITKAALCNEDDVIIEIGPGPGGLTRSILKTNIKKLVIIEQDERCVEALKELKYIHGDRLEIINADALTINLENIAPKNSKIIANLPYNIATVLLFKWLENIGYYNSLILMFQKEVADRITAKPRTKQYGRLSIMIQSYCNIKHIFDIPASAFTPRPKVTSSVLKIEPHNRNDHISKEKLSSLCKLVFNQRRKFLKSTIKPLIDSPLLIFKDLGILETSRPEELSINQFCSLTQYI